MPVTIRQGTVNFKDSSNEYVPINAVAQQTSEAEIAAIQSLSNTEKSAIQSLSTTEQTAIQTKGTETLASIPNDYTALSDEVDDLKSAISSSGYNTDLWEVGSLDAGYNYASTTRLRTITRLDQRIIEAYTSNNYEFMIFAWGADGEYVGKYVNTNEFASSGTTLWVKTFNFAKYPNYTYRLVLRNGSSTSATMTVSEAQNIIFIMSASNDAYLDDALSSITKHYTNLLSVSTGAKTISVSSGSGNAYISSGYVDITSGKKYYIYANVSISDLASYTQGYMYLRPLYAVDGGGWSTHPVTQIENNGTYDIGYVFTASNTGKIAAQIYINNMQPSTNSFKVTANKLFFAETDDDITSELSAVNSQSEIYTQYTELIVPGGSVSYDTLADDVKAMLPQTPEESSIIDCWGDSFTQGAGSTDYPYPTKLQSLVGNSFTVNNYGQGSESAEAIAFRQGGMSAIIEPFTASTSYVTLDSPVSVDGASLGTLNYSGLYYGNNIVTINGIQYYYRRVSETQCKLARISGSSNPTYTRPMLMKAEGKGKKHVMIVCIGQNGWGTETGDGLCDVIQNMIDYNGVETYLVLGIPSGNAESRAELESIMGSRFGDHFVNLREYISAYGIADNDLTATADDETAMSAGAIPPQLHPLNDNVHLNDYGYIAMAKCVYARGVSLGYWD